MKDTARSPFAWWGDQAHGAVWKKPSRPLARPFSALRPPHSPAERALPDKPGLPCFPFPHRPRSKTKPKEKPRSLCKSRCGRRRGGLAPRRGDPGARTPGWGGRCISTARTRGEFRHPPPRSPPPARPRALRACGCCGSRVLPEGGQRGRVRRASGGGKGGTHGVRGTSGGVPARGPGLSPDICPRAPHSPPVFTLRKHSMEGGRGLRGRRPPRGDGPPAGRRSLRRAGARRPWCRESTPGRDALREGSVARRHCPSARAGHPRPAGT